MGEIKKYIKQEDFDRIISMTFLYGKSIEEVAAAIGCGRNTVSSCKQAFKCLRDGDLESLISSIGCSNNEKRMTIDYDKTPFHCAFDGADMREES